MRTTLDIADPVLRDLKRLQRATGKSLGELASELIATGLANVPKRAEAAAFNWISTPMGALVDLADREAVYRILDSKP
jgi:hypothetical protein